MTKLNEEQQLVFESFKAGTNIFLCGKGGSGKSYLTRYILDYCKNKQKKTIVCAPTGIAALNINGSTIHSAFGVPTGIIEPGRRCLKDKKLDTLNAADVIVIDEISMCRIDVFEYVANTLLRLNSKKQLLVVGDFYQLPPVLRDEDKEAFAGVYGDRLFAFQSSLWNTLQLQTMELQTSMRQKDKDFVKALDSIREGTPDFSVFPEESTDPTALTICGTNAEADGINKTRLRELTGAGAKLFKIEASIVGNVAPSEMPTDKVLTLCVGARVVMLNNDKDKMWVNGTFGEISSIEGNNICVRLENGLDAYVERHKWVFCDYELETDKKGKKRIVEVERGTFEQFPVRLAWAITIHKSQGQTYDRINVNIKSIFADGQLYVALSRCKSLKGMNVQGKLSEDKAMANKAVIDFMKMGDTRPQLLGPMLPFEEIPGSDSKFANPIYQDGYDDGYKDGENDTEERYRKKVENDPGLKVLSAKTRRKKELEQIDDPQERNPKGAGRKKKPINEKIDSKAIRVPGALADILKKIGDFAKDNPGRVEEFAKGLNEWLSNQDRM